MHQHTSSFSGASGTDYRYDVCSANFTPQAKQFYNYLFADLSPEGRWVPVFIGQGDLKQYLSDQAHVRGIAHTRSTHVLAHISPDEQQRRKEALDMLTSHPQAQALSGCNKNSLANASLSSASKTGNGVASVDKTARRTFPNDQAFKNHAPLPHLLDTVWTRLRAKVKV